MRYPTDNHRKTSRFGRRIVGQTMDAWHSGQDYGCHDPKNPTNDPIYSIEAGKVRVAKTNPGGYGKYVVVEHDGYCTLYAHLSQINVTVGQDIREGHVLGLMGATGATDALHLHFEVRDVPYSDFWIRWEHVVHNGDREPYYAIDPEFFFYKHMNYAPVETEDLLRLEVEKLTAKLNNIYK